MLAWLAILPAFLSAQFKILFVDNPNVQTAVQSLDVVFDTQDVMQFCMKAAADTV